MAGENNIAIQISASIEGLLSGLQQATGAVKQNTAAMESAFGGVAKAINNLKAPFLAISGLLAGGALFKGVVDATKDWNKEVGGLARTLGVTTETASVYGVMLNSLGISQDSMAAGVGAVAKQIVKGGEGFASYGVEVKNSNGTLRPAISIMNEALDVVRKYPDAMSQNVVGQQMFGKAWESVKPLLKASQAEFQKASQEAEKLGLVLGKDSVAQTKQYERTLRELELTWKAVQIQVGQYVMPILVKLGEWMAGNGGTVVQGFATALKWVIYVLDTTQTAVQALIIRFYTLVTAIGTGGAAIGNAISLAFKGKFGEASTAVKGAVKEIGEQFKLAGGFIDTLYSDLDKRNGELFLPGKKAPTEPESIASTTAVRETGGTEETKKKKVITDESLKFYEAQLQAEKLLEENWFTWSETREKQYWQDKLKMYVEFGGEDVDVIQGINQKILASGKQGAMAEHEVRLANYREMLTEAGENGKQRIAILRAIAQEEARIYGEGSKQAINSQRDIAKEINAQAKQTTAIKKQWVEGMVNPIVSSMGSAFKGLITGAKSFGQAMEDVAMAILDTFIDMGVKLLAQWIVEMIMGKTKNTSETMGNIAVATAGAAAAMASIPFIGPGLALAAAAETEAALIGMTSPLLMASGGYDIPWNSNPMIQAHADEVVLPAPLSKGIKEMIANGRQGGGDTYQITVQALDAQSFGDAMDRNATGFVKFVKKLNRNGRL